MTDENPAIVEFNGHQINTDETPLSRFKDGETGAPITDEQWDEQKRVLEQPDVPFDEIDFADGPFEENS